MRGNKGVFALFHDVFAYIIAFFLIVIFIFMASVGDTPKEDTAQKVDFKDSYEKTVLLTLLRTPVSSQVHPSIDNATLADLIAFSDDHGLIEEEIGQGLQYLCREREEDACMWKVNMSRPLEEVDMEHDWDENSGLDREGKATVKTPRYHPRNNPEVVEIELQYKRDER